MPDPAVYSATRCVAAASSGDHNGVDLAVPHGTFTVRDEVHRILKKKPGSIYVGSAPLDYHLHRRWKVLRGKRL